MFAFCAQSPRCIGLFPFLWNSVGRPLDDACCMGVKDGMPEVLLPALEKMGAAIKDGAVAELMKIHEKDPAVQMRGCMVLQKLLSVQGVSEMARTTGALRAVVRALQMLSVHGCSLLRYIITDKDGDKKNVEAFITSLTECCDHDRKDLKDWLGMLPKGFLAMPTHLLEKNESFGEAIHGKKWQSTKNKWSAYRAVS